MRNFVEKFEDHLHFFFIFISNICHFLVNSVWHFLKILDNKKQ